MSPTKEAMRAAYMAGISKFHAVKRDSTFPTDPVLDTAGPEGGLFLDARDRKHGSRFRPSEHGVRPYSTTK